MANCRCRSDSLNSEPVCVSCRVTDTNCRPTCRHDIRSAFFLGFIGSCRWVISSETINLASSDIVVDGATLTPGSPAVTVNGIRVSLGPSVLVVGRPIATTASGGLGALIISGFGGVPSVSTASPTAKSTGNTTTGYGATPFLGNATKSKSRSGLSKAVFAALASWIVGLGW